jgi:hypothetical protein
MNTNSFCTIEHILSEVTASLNDREYRSGFSKGWYISRIQDALQELSFDTFYQVVTRDYDFPTSTLQMEMPSNAFNLREIYGWNGACCSPQSSAIIYPKRLYNNKGGNGRGYTARVKKTGESIGNDPFHPNYANDGNFRNYPDAKYFYNIQNGLIMFSSSCAGFLKVRLIFNGIGIDNVGDVPIIPRFFERAINDYVEERFYNAKKAEDPRKYRILWADAYGRLTDYVNGAWAKAIKRVKYMDKAEAEAYSDYLSNPLHK